MPVSNEQFLFSCIDHSANGSVNWQKVADECDLPTKGAASIKFRRMKEKFGTVGGGTPEGNRTPASGGKKTPKNKAGEQARTISNDDDGDDDEPGKVKKSTAMQGGGKKRKLEQDADGEPITPVKPEEDED